MTPASFSSVRLSAAIIVSAALFGGGAALAQDQGSEAQREACTPDVFRLCGQFIPDASRIEGCLRAAGPRLSPACYVVFNPPSAQTPSLRTARRQGQTTVGQAPVQRVPANAEAAWTDDYARPTS